MSTYCAGSWLLGGSDVTTSQNTGGARLPDGRAAASACRRGAPWSLWWLPASSGCTARRWGATGRGWGGTSGRWGLRAVDTTLGQWIPTLVEQVDSGPLLTGAASNHDHRAPAQATGRRRAGDGGGGPVTEVLGCAVRTSDSLLRGLVSTALTLASPASARSAGIVGILRFLLLCAVPIRVNVSAVDTHTPSCLVSRPPSPPGPPACPRFLPERVSQKS